MAQVRQTQAIAELELAAENDAHSGLSVQAIPGWLHHGVRCGPGSKRTEQAGKGCIRPCRADEALHRERLSARASTIAASIAILPLLWCPLASHLIFFLLGPTPYRFVGATIGAADERAPRPAQRHITSPFPIPLERRKAAILDPDPLTSLRHLILHLHLIPRQAFGLHAPLRLPDSPGSSAFTSSRRRARPVRTPRRSTGFDPLIS